MAKLKIAMLAGIAALSYGVTALAVAPVSTGFYVEGNIGKSYTHLSASDAGVYGTTSISSQSGLGGSLNLGYKMMPYAAVELGLTKYADAKANDSSGNKLAKLSYYSYDAAFKGILPYSEYGIDFFGKLGIARSIARYDDLQPGAVLTGSDKYTTNSIYYGLGMDYAITPNILANVQWNRDEGQSDKTGHLDLISIGLSYTFG